MVFPRNQTLSRSRNAAKARKRKAENLKDSSTEPPAKKTSAFEELEQADVSVSAAQQHPEDYEQIIGNSPSGSTSETEPVDKSSPYSIVEPSVSAAQHHSEGCGLIAEDCLPASVSLSPVYKAEVWSIHDNSARDDLPGPQYDDGLYANDHVCLARPSTSSTLLCCESELQIAIEERTAELEVFSQEIFVIREEITTTRMRNEQLKREKLTIEAKIMTIRKNEKVLTKQLAKSRIVLESMLQKAKNNLKSTRTGSRWIRRTFNPYSQLQNSSARKSRKWQAFRALQQIGNENDVGSLIRDLIGYVESIPNQSFQRKFSLFQAVVMKTKANLSLGALDEIKKHSIDFLGFDILPPVKMIAKASKEISRIDLFESSEHITDAGDVITVTQCSNIILLLRWRLEMMFRLLRFDEHSGEDIIIAIGGDSGGGTTKVCLIIGNVDEPNSTDHVLTIAVFDAPDTFESVHKYLKSTCDQLNRIDKVTYTVDGIEITRNVRQKLVGDFKWTGEVIGHMRQSARFFCPYCFAENERGDDRKTLADLRDADVAEERTIASYFELSKTGQKGVKKGRTPLFLRISMRNYLIGMLHLVTGLFLRYIFEPLWTSAVSMDNTTSFEICKDKKTTLKMANMKIKSMKEQLKKAATSRDKTRLGAKIRKFESERDTLLEIVNGKKGGLLRKLEQEWEKVGASRRAFYQSFNGNHTKKILSQNGIEATFKVFSGKMTPRLQHIKTAMSHLSTIMKLSENRVLNQNDIDTIKKTVWDFAEALAESSPTDSITQKLHVLCYHVPQFAMFHKTLGKLSEQGIEATHAKFNRLERRFASIRSKSERYKHCLQELLVSNLSSDYMKTRANDHSD